MASDAIFIAACRTSGDLVVARLILVGCTGFLRGMVPISG
jgi:hypothetical protein